MNYFISGFFLSLFIIGCVCILTDMVVNKDNGLENDNLRDSDF